MVSLSASSRAKAMAYLQNLGFPVGAAEMEKILHGELVKVSIDTLTERELAAAFAVVIPKSPRDVQRIFLENLGKQDADESIQQLVNSSKDDNKTLDFSTLKLLPAKSATAMVTQYVNPKSFADLNLSAAESAQFHALNSNNNAKVEDVEQTLRKVLAHRLEEYQQKGLEGIAPYQRGKSTFEPGKELLERCQKLQVLHKHAPEFAKYIIEYPNSKPATGQIQESFTMMNFNIDDKPTFSLVHKILYQRDDHEKNSGDGDGEGGHAFFVFHRHFYVSRGHNSVQAVGGGESVGGDNGDDNNDNDASPPAATILVFSSRTSTDQVAGFGGSAKRVIGSRIMGDKLFKNLSTHLAEIKNQDV
jgi:hypothetical protein